MKKIKNIKHLKKEKKNLQQREKELLRQISSGWHELTEGLRPKKILGEQLRRCRDEKEKRAIDDDNILKSILSFSATLLARKLAIRTGEKIESFFS